MATKKFRCKVCGYIHEGDKAPEKCPVCQAPASEFEEIVEAAENGTLKEIFGAGTAAVINQIEAFSYKDKMYELPNMDNEGSYALDLKDKLTKIQNKLADDSFGWTVKI